MDITVVELCRKAYESKNFAELAHQFYDIETFYCILLMENRETLLKMFDALYDQHNTILRKLENRLFRYYIDTKEVDYEMALKITIELGEFLIQIGHFQGAIKFLSIYEDHLFESIGEVSLGLQIYQKLLHLDAILHQFKQQTKLMGVEYGGDIVSDNDRKVRRLLLYENNFLSRRDVELNMNLACVFSYYSVLHFAMCRYDLAFNYALDSIRNLKQDDDMNIVIQVLRQASKACTVNQFFVKGKYFIVEAMGRARQFYTNLDRNPKYAEVLMDYAFFLRKFGKFKESKEKYEEALTTYKNVFGQKNLHIVMAEIDLVEALIEGKLYDGSTIRLIEDAIKFIKSSKSIRDKNPLLIKAYIVKATLLQEMFNSEARSKVPYVMIEKLNRIRIVLHKIERTIMETYGVTSSLYSRNLIILTNIYFSMNNYEEAFNISIKFILGKETVPFPDVREKNVLKLIVKAEMASTVIRSCNVIKYRKQLVAATRTLESNVARISECVAYDKCRELGQFYKTLMNAHQKIFENKSANSGNKYHIYENNLLDWKRDWGQNYDENFTKISGTITIHEIQEIVNICKQWERTFKKKYPSIYYF